MSALPTRQTRFYRLRWITLFVSEPLHPQLHKYQALIITRTTTAGYRNAQQLEVRQVGDVRDEHWT